MFINIDLFSRNAKELIELPLNVVPQLVIAIAIIIVGCIFGWLIDKVIRSIFRALPFFDTALKNVGLEEMTKRAGLRVDIGKFFGVIFRIFIIFVFLVMAFDVLNLEAVNQFFINQVLVYIPNVISASIILIIGLLAANFFGNIVVGASRAAKVEGGLAGKVTKWAIVVFSTLVALSELGVASTIIESLVVGVIAAVSLALGLAFGLGGQKSAGELIDRIKHDIERG